MRATLRWRFAFLLLFMWQAPPWLVVVLSALGGAGLARL
jgi:chromate transporter